MGEEDVLKHSFRKLLYKYVVEHPGTSFKILHSVFNIPQGTLRYHLLKLERCNMINKSKTGNKVRYYSTLHQLNNCKASILELSKKQTLLLDIIKNEPGLKTSVIAQKTGWNKKDLYYNLRKLREMRLIWKSKDMGYEPLLKEDLKREMSYMLIDQFLEGKIDRERFDSLISKLDEI